VNISILADEGKFWNSISCVIFVADQTAEPLNGLGTILTLSFQLSFEEIGEPTYKANGEPLTSLA